MSTVQEIESAISQLSHPDLIQLRAWFEEFAADAWDRQIEADARSGRVDAFNQRLQQENEIKPDSSFDEVADYVVRKNAELYRRLA